MKGAGMETHLDNSMLGEAAGNALLYALPAGALLLILWLVGVPENFWTPVLIVYLIAALGFMLSSGFQMVCLQIHMSADYAANAVRSSTE